MTAKEALEKSINGIEELIRNNKERDAIFEAQEDDYLKSEEGVPGYLIRERSELLQKRIVMKLCIIQIKHVMDELEKESP